MERWFTAFFECETYGGIPKAEILKKIVRNVPAALALAPVKRENASGEAAEDIGAHSPAHEAEQGAVRHLGQGRCIMIGDRESDLEAARAAEGRFIGCRYGYGTAEELSGSDVCISCISDLPEAVKCLEMRP